MFKFLGLLFLGLSVFLGVNYFSKRFLDWLRFQSLGTRDYVVERLGLMFIQVDPDQTLIVLSSVSIFLGGVTFLIFLPHWITGLILGGMVASLSWKIPRPVVDYMYSQRIDKFTLQMVDGLSLMSNGMKSGLSVVQALALVTQEMEDPIRQEFNLVLSENKLGVSLEEAFLNLSKRVRTEDVEMFVTAINILKETGGNLAETFDTIVGTIRERIKVQKKIAALVAQGLYQGMFMIAIPPILGVMFYLTDPDMMRPLFTTVLGWVILFIVLVLEVIGFVVIRKVVQIEV